MISSGKEWKGKEIDDILKWHFSLHKLFQVQNNADAAASSATAKERGVIPTFISVYVGSLCTGRFVASISGGCRTCFLFVEECVERPSKFNLV
jgi:hypothetical protein